MSKKLLKILLIIIAAACVVVCAVSIIFIWQYKKGLSDHEALVSQVKSGFSLIKDKTQPEDGAQLPEATEEPVVDLPVDFAALALRVPMTAIAASSSSECSRPFRYITTGGAKIFFRRCG